MPLPKPRIVPREAVHTAVQLMLTNPDVGTILCNERADRDYLVTPLPRDESGDSGDSGNGPRSLSPAGGPRRGGRGTRSARATKTRSRKSRKRS